MVSIASKVGPPRSSQRPTVMNLKLAVSRYDFVTVGPIAGREVLASFEDQLGSVIDYEDIPHEALVYIFRAVDTLRKYIDPSLDLAGVDITIEKHIPLNTYIDGRHTTADAVMVARAVLWDASIAREDIARLDRHVGYGVADAIIGGDVISSLQAAEETTTSVLSQGQIALVLVPAAAGLSDAEVFQTVQAISSADIDAVADQRLLEFDQQLIDAVSR